MLGNRAMFDLRWAVWPVCVATMVVSYSSVILCAQPADDPPDVPIFRAGTTYVEVDAYVTDRNGRLVRDLTAEDFQVYEDGQIQTVVASTFVEVPLSPYGYPVSLPAPDVSSNARDRNDGRLYLLVLDDLHTHQLRSDTVREVARHFIERSMGTNDRAAIVVTSGRQELTHEFTGNRKRLVATIERFVGQRPPMSERFMGIMPPILPGQLPSVGPQPFRHARPNRVAEMQAYEAGVTLRSLKRWAEWMAGLGTRRKVLVFVSEGIDHDMGDVFHPDTDDLRADMRETIAAAARNNVVIYGVDPRGLPTGKRSSIRTVLTPDEDHFSADVWRAQQTLRALSEETGGFSVVDSNEFGLAFDQIVVENSGYYLLGYNAPREAPDGERHRIDVRVTRPNLVVRARRSYLARSGAASDAPEVGAIPTDLAKLLVAPLPESGLTMAVSAAVFRGVDDLASVVVVVEAQPWIGGLLTSQRRIDESGEGITLSIVAADRNGQVREGRRILLPSSVRRDGLRVVTQLQLPSGDFQLRVGASDSDTRSRGSVHHDLTVPDFSTGGIAISDVVVSSVLATDPVTVDEARLKSMPVWPTTIRQFLPEDELVLFGEVYDTAGEDQVDVTVTVSRRSGEVALQYEDTLVARDGDTAGLYEYSARIPLVGLEPDLYLLGVEARSTTGADEPAGRQLLFNLSR